MQRPPASPYKNPRRPATLLQVLLGLTAGVSPATPQTALAELRAAGVVLVGEPTLGRGR